MKPDNQQQVENQVRVSKPQWVKPQLESLDLGATEGKTYNNTFEFPTSSSGPS
ncbi:hypothetical protein AB4238_12530 [Shewanella sp. 10N.286.45.A1]|uniref:hypothetical protein n=1 Tax=Shewanella sp. 10N.286.45.A1 TaxID=3229694 RepID=UPI00354DEF32